jgi:hypothetical protein
MLVIKAIFIDGDAEENYVAFAIVKKKEVSYTLSSPIFLKETHERVPALKL